VGELALSHDDRILIIYVQQDLPADGTLKPQGQQKERELMVMTYEYKPPMTWIRLV
jgi:hypothetical protein